MSQLIHRFRMRAWARIVVGAMAVVLLASAAAPTASYAQQADPFIRPVPPQAFVHVVQPGDTLNSIARQHGVTTAEILSINPEITNPNRIAVGQRIWIPVAVQQPSPPQRPTPQPTPRPPFSPPIAGDPDADFLYTQVFLIAPGDNGAIGTRAACGDSVVPVWVQAPPSQAVLRTSLETLLSLDGPFHSESGFYNPLSHSNLTLSNLQLQNGVATIHLTGRLAASNYCERAQVRAQLTQTATQFSTVNRADIFVNGQRL